LPASVDCKRFRIVAMGRSFHGIPFKSY
jgi:hypothetical protein